MCAGVSEKFIDFLMGLETVEGNRQTALFSVYDLPLMPFQCSPCEQIFKELAVLKGWQRIG